MRSDLIDVRNVRMVKSRCRLRLLYETARAIAGVARSVTEDLHGNVALELIIMRDVNLPHPARAEERADFIPPESGAGSESHECAAILPLSSRHDCAYRSLSPTASVGLFR